MIKMSMDLKDWEFISMIHVRIEAKIIEPNATTLEAMMVGYTKTNDLQSTNEAFDWTLPHRRPAASTMLSIMATTYFAKGDVVRGNKFLNKIKPYTSSTYIIVLKYGIVDVNHIERILEELRVKQIEITKEIYEAALYAYVRMENIPKAEKVPWSLESRCLVASIFYDLGERMLLIGDMNKGNSLNYGNFHVKHLTVWDRARNGWIDSY